MGCALLFGNFNLGSTRLQSSDVELRKRVADHHVRRSTDQISHEIDLTSDRFVTTF
jgi:hypothetical protein